MVSESTLYRNKLKLKDPVMYQAYLDNQKKASKDRREKLKQDLSSLRPSRAAKQELQRKRELGRLRQKRYRTK